MKFVGFLLLLLLFAVASAGFLLYVPFGPHSETFVDIPSGFGTNSIASRLHRHGVIRSQYAFDLFRKVKGGTLRAGEYRFDHPATLAEVYARIARGDVYTRAVSVPEGFNIFDVAQAVQNAGMGSAADFLAAERHETSLIADLNPGAKSLEGYLFPDTYRFSRRATPQQMLAAMVKRFRQETAKLGLPPNPDIARIVTEASLVEKEVSVDQERPLVAGVFENRLAAGIPLATDPTVIYAALLDARWRGTIHQSDLQADSSFNTYRHPGLPPGAICNPGVAALQAAIHPAKTKYLYFVADAQGHSQFSTDLKQHLAHVEALRQAERAARHAE